MKDKTHWNNMKKCAARSKIWLGQTQINSDDYDEKYMKVKFNSDDNLSLKKTLEILNMMTIVVISVFYEGKKYYLEFFLDKCWYKL